MNEQAITLKDVIQVPSQCRHCHAEGRVNTLKWIVEDEENVVGKQLKDVGYVEITCADCA